jgi:hypothetical protein
MRVYVYVPRRKVLCGPECMYAQYFTCIYVSFRMCTLEAWCELQPICSYLLGQHICSRVTAHMLPCYSIYAPNKYPTWYMYIRVYENVTEY